MVKDIRNDDSSMWCKLWLFGLPLLLVLPFDPDWLDFERARRGILLILVGSAVLLPGLRRADGWGRALAPFAALAGVALLSVIWAKHDRLAALEHGSYLLALATLTLLVSGSENSRAVLIKGFTWALLLTCGYGIAQSQGLDPFFPQKVQWEPVSTFGNTNAAAEWTVMAAPLALLATPVLSLVTLALADLYLWLNGGRAGLIAFHLVLLAVLLLPRACSFFGKPRIAVVAILVLAPVLGSLMKRTAPPPLPVASGQAAERQSGRGDTLAVRFKIYARTLRMAREHLPLGTGAGNFRTEFPRYRDPEEIAISSLGHALTSRVKTAHNDPLQILTELGILGALLLVLLLAELWRAWRVNEFSPLGLVSLCAMAPITLSRAPLLNAPAALAFFLALSLALGSERRRPLFRIPRPVFPLLGLLLLWPGVSAVLGESLAAAFARSKAYHVAHPEIPASVALKKILVPLELAQKLDPFESDWHLHRAVILERNLKGQGRERILADLDRVLSRRPGEYQALALLGKLGASEWRSRMDGANRELVDAGRRALTQLLAIYPEHKQGLAYMNSYRELDLLLDAKRSGKHSLWLELLEKLEDRGLLLYERNRVQRMLAQSSDTMKRLAFAQLLTKLNQLGRKLFPGDSEFVKE